MALPLLHLFPKAKDIIITLRKFNINTIVLLNYNIHTNFPLSFNTILYDSFIFSSDGASFALWQHMYS